jgi:hypothetical protein
VARGQGGVTFRPGGGSHPRAEARSGPTWKHPPLLPCFRASVLPCFRAFEASVRQRCPADSGNDSAEDLSCCTYEDRTGADCPEDADAESVRFELRADSWGARGQPPVIGVLVSRRWRSEANAPRAAEEPCFT